MVKRAISPIRGSVGQMGEKGLGWMIRQKAPRKDFFFLEESPGPRVYHSATGLGAEGLWVKRRPTYGRGRTGRLLGVPI